MLVDTHAHLDFPEFEGQLEAVLERAAQAGVTRVVTIGTTLEKSRRAVEIAQRFPQVYAAVGIHPGHAHEIAPRERAAHIEALAALAREPKVVAIGETGLDYYRLPGGEEEARAVKAAQAEIFAAQLEIARARGLNVVVHQRGDCMRDTLDLLAPFENALRAVFHCFAGTPEEAGALIARGHLVSFTGIVTFKNSEPMRSCAAGVPDGAYMVETDAPYLAPAPLRGQTCEPAHTRLTAEKIAALRSQSLETVAASTTAVAKTLFQW